MTKGKWIAVCIVSLLVLASACFMAGYYIRQRSDIQAQIQILEKCLKQNPEMYNWPIKLMIRNLYGSINPRKSMEYSDIILKNSPMDGYIINILGGWQIDGWQIDKDPAIARTNLLMQAKSYPDLKFVNVACLIKVGDIYAWEGNYTEAENYYTKVAGESSSDMAKYQAIANQRIKDLPEVKNRAIEAKARQDRLVGKPAPNIATTTLSGELWKLSEHKGKIVVLDFWATWCGPCVGAVPQMKEIYAKYKNREDFMLVGISLDTEASNVVSFCQQKGIEWLQLIEPGAVITNSVVKAFGVRGIPDICIINRDGNVEAVGAWADNIEKTIEKLLTPKN